MAGGPNKSPPKQWVTESTGQLLNQSETVPRRESYLVLSLSQMSKCKRGCFFFEYDLFALNTSMPEPKLLNDVYKLLPNGPLPPLSSAGW